ncbi:hypothetical protein M378DRAFT_857549 [Amanita muscaria Koide BX008]|uniref:Uncharacterized protein n=1 Tax=Amanita muscaria (strain Koide BX008) TaxID=946122 RepID=A0A0C2WIJ1_AMAMK|nr:hypothetical protein M378DRAFT_857549 [Amanita muscaria Koide BX008]
MLYLYDNVHGEVWNLTSPLVEKLSIPFFSFPVVTRLLAQFRPELLSNVAGSFRGHATEVGICAGQAYILNAVVSS